jgi:type IV pilus biogenesis protein CpaD/CtpE
MRSGNHALVLMAVAAALVAGPAAANDPGLGLVTQNNIAAMLVDPNPTYANVKMEGTNGTTAGEAVSRYRAGKVKPLLPLSGRSDVGTAGAEAGGGGGGQMRGQN